MGQSFVSLAVELVKNLLQDGLDLCDVLAVVALDDVSGRHRVHLVFELLNLPGHVVQNVGGKKPGNRHNNVE